MSLLQTVRPAGGLAWIHSQATTNISHHELQVDGIGNVPKANLQYISN
jgi:hypothetical protein